MICDANFIFDIQGSVERASDQLVKLEGFRCIDGYSLRIQFPFTAFQTNESGRSPNFHLYFFIDRCYSSSRFRSLLLLLLLLDQFVDILRLFKSLENEGKETRDSCFTADSISPAFRIIPENRTIDIGRKGGVRFTVVEKGGRVSSSDGDTFTALTR